MHHQLWAKVVRPRFVAAAAVCLMLGAVLAASSGAATSRHAGRSNSVTPATASRWMAGYLKAWETRDANAVVKLFTPNGVYQSIPGVKSQTFDGRAAIHKYWFNITRPQSQIHGIQGRPIVNGNRASIEIWVTFVDPQYNPKGKHRITLLETNILTFARGGLVSKNAEYWNIIMGFHKPPPGWGR